MSSFGPTTSCLFRCDYPTIRKIDLFPKEEVLRREKIPFSSRGRRWSVDADARMFDAALWKLQVFLPSLQQLPRVRSGVYAILIEAR